MKKFYIFFAAVLLAAIISACSDDDTGTNPPVVTPYESASSSTGGIMYDRFWSNEAGFNQSDPNVPVFNASSEFFRCKTCHAWDLKGREGSYISRGPTSTRPRVAALNLSQYIQGKTPQQLFDAIKTGSGAARRDISYNLTQYNPTTNPTEGEQMPKYSQLLTDAQIWNIVKFLLEGALNVNELYDGTFSGTYPTGSAVYSNVGKDGNPANGSSYYSSNCSSCHGSNGTAIPLGGLSVGRFTRTKPYEVQHKVKFGQLGTGMTGEFDITLTQMKDMYKALNDTLAFPN